MLAISKKTQKTKQLQKNPRKQKPPQPYLQFLSFFENWALSSKEVKEVSSYPLTPLLENSSSDWSMGTLHNS